MPCNICGNASDLTVTRAVTGSMLIADLTTTVPRSYGPAWAGTTTIRLNGAPLYGPPKYAAVGVLPGWGTHNGAGPAPVAACTRPTKDASGHFPLAASPPSHSGT